MNTHERSLIEDAAKRDDALGAIARVILGTDDKSAEKALHGQKRTESP